MSSIFFPDIPKVLNETYDFVSKVVTDIRKLKRELSNKEQKKLLADFQRGLEAINQITSKILAKFKAAKILNKEVHLSPKDYEIRGKINDIAEELNQIIQTEAMRKFLGKQTEELQEKAYIKLELEGVDDFGNEKISEEEAEHEFLRWIGAVNNYTKELLDLWNEAVKKSF